MSKRVLFLVNHDVVIYNFRRELVERLIDDGYEVYISSPYGERIDYLIDMECMFKENRLLDRHGTKITGELKLVQYYKKLINEVQPDIVLTYTIKPNIYGGMACKSLGIPYVANITGLGTAVENGGIMQKITTFLYKRAFSNVQTVFFQNGENKQFFEDRRIATEQQKLIPGSGVNIDYYETLDYPNDEVVDFVFISRIMEQKGIEQYLDAAEYIHNKYPNTKFHICGFIEENRYEEKINRLVENGVVEYHGMVSNIKDVLKYTHATVHPSYHEGMSNVLLESAASGRPVIASNVSGCRETFDDNITGLSFEVKNTTSLINAIEKFLEMSNEDRKKMGELGREKMVREFDRQIIVDEYLEEINQISKRGI